MSRPTQAPAPELRGADRAAGGSGTVQEPWLAAVAASAVPPLDSITSGDASPARRARSVSRSR